MVDKVEVQKSATVNVSDTRVKDITDAAKKVGAPTDARVATGGANYPNGFPQDGSALPHSVTFTWSEEV